jgi:hypothetical protein
MYPLSGQEQKVCENLFAHIAALNAINESEMAIKFTLLEELIPFVEKLLQKTTGTEIIFVPKIFDKHLHICRNSSHFEDYPDLAIISYLNK